METKTRVCQRHSGFGGMAVGQALGSNGGNCQGKANKPKLPKQAGKDRGETALCQKASEHLLLAALTAIHIVACREKERGRLQCR